MLRALRTALLAIGAALVIVLAATWYGRLQRCQAEIDSWTRVQTTLLTVKIAVFSPDTPLREEQLVAYGLRRTEDAIRRYCDAPIWEWWR
jgi:hypothetical protein